MNDLVHDVLNPLGYPTTIAGIHSSGNSDGIQTLSSSLTYNSAASMLWELNANTVTNTPLVVFDQVDVNGTLNFAGKTLLNISQLGGVDLSNTF